MTKEKEKVLNIMKAVRLMVNKYYENGQEIDNLY